MIPANAETGNVNLFTFLLRRPRNGLVQCFCEVNAEYCPTLRMV